MLPNRLLLSKAHITVKATVFSLALVLETQVWFLAITVWSEGLKEWQHWIRRLDSFGQFQQMLRAKWSNMAVRRTFFWRENLENKAWKSEFSICFHTSLWPSPPKNAMVQRPFTHSISDVDNFLFCQATASNNQLIISRSKSHVGI